MATYTNVRVKPGICEVCGTHFLGFRSSTGRFCSNACKVIAMRVNVQPLMEAFAERFARRVVTEDGCWLWPNKPNQPDGYGEFRDIPVHHLAWEAATGCKIPVGLIILHTCDVKLCMRNDESGIYVVGGQVLPRLGHLALGTRRDNMRDASEKGHSAAGAFRRALLKPESYPRGENSHRAKLTNAQAADIRARYAAGGVIKRILAAEYEVSMTVIKTILAGKTYREHLD